MIAYLAHIGSFLPAKKAVVGVLDQIHTRIQTTESAASQLSAFLIDLRQVSLSAADLFSVVCYIKLMPLLSR